VIVLLCALLGADDFLLLGRVAAVEAKVTALESRLASIEKADAIAKQMAEAQDATLDDLPIGVALLKREGALHYFGVCDTGACPVYRVRSGQTATSPVWLGDGWYTQGQDGIYRQDAARTEARTDLLPARAVRWRSGASRGGCATCR
jgi:hypothetical protein